MKTVHVSRARLKTACVDYWRTQKKIINNCRSVVTIK